MYSRSKTFSPWTGWKSCNFVSMSPSLLIPLSPHRTRFCFRSLMKALPFKFVPILLIGRIKSFHKSTKKNTKRTFHSCIDDMAAHSKRNNNGERKFHRGLQKCQEKKLFTINEKKKEEQWKGKTRLGATSFVLLGCEGQVSSCSLSLFFQTLTKKENKSGKFSIFSRRFLHVGALKSEIWFIWFTGIVNFQTKDKQTLCNFWNLRTNKIRMRWKRKRKKARKWIKIQITSNGFMFHWESFSLSFSSQWCRCKMKDYMS